MDIHDLIRHRSDTVKELGAILLVSTLFFILSLALEVDEWVEAVRMAIPLGEIFLTLILFVILLGYFVARRWRDLQAEVAAREQLEDKLRRSQAQLAEAQQVAGVGSWEWQPATNTVTWSDELFRMYGFRPQEFEPTFDAYVERIHPDDREWVMDVVSQTLEDKESFNHNHRFLQADGTVRIMDARGEVVIDQSGTVDRMVGTAQDITERKRYEEQLQETNAALDRSVQELERRNREINLLSDLSEMLQSCATEAEAYQIVGRYVPRFFPQSSGALYIISASRNILEVVVSWGEVPYRGVHAPKECWALRRGRPHVITDPETEFACQHIDNSSPGQTLCVPMMAQGEALGVLHMSHLDEAIRRRDAIERPVETIKQLSVTLADHIALSISNLMLRDSLQHQALRDPLTDLFNRRYMEESLERELRRAERRETALGVIMIDLDHFKRFNDTNGHAAGDVVLRKLGTFLRANSRGEDIACRYGGEEFTLIFPDTGLQHARERAEELRQAFKTVDMQYRDQTLGTVTLSMGVASYPQHGTTVDELFRSADTALYHAKARGRDCVAVAEAEAV